MGYSVDPLFSVLTVCFLCTSGIWMADCIWLLSYLCTERSFPTHRTLMGESPEAIEGQAKLFRVLIAYAKYNPKIGYSQGTVRGADCLQSCMHVSTNLERCCLNIAGAVWWRHRYMYAITVVLSLNKSIWISFQGQYSLLMFFHDIQKQFTYHAVGSNILSSILQPLGGRRV